MQFEVNKPIEKWNRGQRFVKSSLVYRGKLAVEG